MSTHYIARRTTVPPGPAKPHAAPIYVDADDDILKMIPAGSGTTEVQIIDASSTQTLTGKTLTSPIITTPTLTGSLGTDSTEVVSATNVIAASESGKTFFLNSATEFASTLPAPAAGLVFRFVVTAAPAGASYTVGTNAAAEVMIGQVYGSDGADADSETTAGATTLTFVDGASVAGDSADFFCDGTNWYVRAFTNLGGTGITFTG